MRIILCDSRPFIGKMKYVEKKLEEANNKVLLPLHKLMYPRINENREFFLKLNKNIKTGMFAEAVFTFCLSRKDNNTYKELTAINPRAINKENLSGSFL